MKLIKFIAWVFCPLFIFTVFESHKIAAPLIGKHPLKDFNISPPVSLFAIEITDGSKAGVEVKDIEIIKPAKKHRPVKLTTVAESTAVIPSPIKIETIDTFAERIKRLNYKPKIKIERKK